MSQPKPFFSIIIPTLNEARYLPKLLTDLVNQTYQDFEVIVVDGGSADKTLALAKEYKSKLNLTLLNSPKAHVCTQRNLGAKRANADTLIFSDADNRLPPYFLQGVKYRWESSHAHILSFALKPDKNTPQNNAIALAMSTFLELQTNVKPTWLLEAMFAIDKKAFEKIGGFDESMDYAEGRSIIQASLRLNLIIKHMKDPLYSFSFRRLRKYGIVNMASRMAKLELAHLIGKEIYNSQAKKLYPMTGGALFSQPRKVKSRFLKNIAKLLKDL